MPLTVQDMNLLAKYKEEEKKRQEAIEQAQRLRADEAEKTRKAAEMKARQEDAKREMERKAAEAQRLARQRAAEEAARQEAARKADAERKRQELLDKSKQSMLDTQRAAQTARLFAQERKTSGLNSYWDAQERKIISELNAAAFAPDAPKETDKPSIVAFGFEDVAVEPKELTPEQKKQQEQKEFSDLQYKLINGNDLSSLQLNRWMELYPEYSHTAGKSTFRARASSGASDVSGGKSIRDQNEEWFTKYVGLINSGYAADFEHRMPSIEQLADYRNMASDLGVTVEQFFTDYYGGKPEWLEKIDYAKKRKTNPELITRLRPIEEVLPDYLAGNELSEAEYELIWQYNKAHPYLLSGMKQIRAADISMPIDMRRQLGATAFAALSAADSGEVTKEESNALILSIGQDMDYIFGRFDTLEEYYAANPVRAAELQAFVNEAKARDEAKAAKDKADHMERQKAVAQAALVTLYDYASGAELNDGQKDFIDHMKNAPVTDDDYNDPAYKQTEEALMNLTYEDLVAKDKTYAQYTDVTVSMEFKRTALESLDIDVRLAKSAGMTLSEMYEMFPELRKSPEEMLDYAKKSVEQKWATDDPISVFGWLFGLSRDELEDNKGVGAWEAFIKGDESGLRKFAQGYMGFWRNYFTETENTDEIEARNRSRIKYSGPMGRAKARKDFDRAISAITNQERREYWQNYKANVKDILDLPFDFADEAVLNALYENQKAINLIRDYMVENATPGEYAFFAITESLVDNGLSTGTALAATALTGNPMVGTAIAFGPRAAYEGSEVMRAAGFPQWARNPVGLVAAGITIYTEKMALTGLKNSAAYVRGSLNMLKSSAMRGGAGYVRKLGITIALGTAAIGTKLGENLVEQGSQEFVESVLTDVWLNIVGAQNKEFGAIIDEGSREAVMTAILSPFLSGQTYIMTANGKVTITDNMRNWATNWLDTKIAEAAQNPKTAEKIIEANAAANTIDTLVNGALADVDTSAVDQAKKEMGAAKQKLAESEGKYGAAAGQYLSVMQEDMQNGFLLTDAEHDMYLKFVEVARKGLDSAKEVYSVLSEKFQQAKDGLDKLLSGIISTARAEGRNSALNEFSSDIDASSQDTGMQKDGFLADDGVITEMPSPENVSIDGDAAGNDSIPLAPNDGSGIINEGTQGEAGNGSTEARKSDGPLAGLWNFESLIELAKKVDVSTGANQAVFYSGKGNRELAEAFAMQNGKMILEMTPGGKFFDNLKLFDPGSPITKDQALEVWTILSQRYAKAASGNVYGIVKGANPGSIFNTVEYQTLQENPHITNIFTEIFNGVD